MLNYSLDIPSGSLYIFPHSRSTSEELEVVALELHHYKNNYGHINNIFIYMEDLDDANIEGFKKFIDLVDASQEYIKKVALIGKHINMYYICEAKGFFTHADVKTFNSFSELSGFSSYHQEVA